MNLFEKSAKDLVVTELQVIRHYVADLKTAADIHPEKPDPVAKGLFYKAALIQSKLNIEYHKRQIALDKTGLSHPTREVMINAEETNLATIKAEIKRLEKELPGFKTALQRAAPRVEVVRG